MLSLSEDLLEGTSTILGLSLLMTIFSRSIIDKDHLLKISILMLGVSIIFWINVRHDQNYGFRIMSLNVGLVTYIAVLCLTSLLGKCIIYFTTKTSKDESRESAFLQSKLLIGVSLLFLPLLAIFYLTHEEYQHLFVSQAFYFSVMVIILALIGISIVDRLLSRFISEEVFRRKLFHIGPILITPIIDGISRNMLISILSGGFFAFFALEIIRYNLHRLQYALKVKKEDQQKISETPLIKHIFSLLNWMESFNQRQKQFWFTHLFLILSLHLSYSLALLHPSQVHGNVVLGMIAADGMAALVGKRYGRIKLFKGKTLEGTLAFIVTLFLWIISIDIDSGRSFFIFKTLLVSLSCSMAELFGGDADNLLTLMVYYLTMVILQ